MTGSLVDAAAWRMWRAEFGVLRSVRPRNATFGPATTMETVDDTITNRSVNCPS